MTIEIIFSIIAITVLRLVWIAIRPVHKDITNYILPGLSNLRKLLKYAPDFSYVPYGLVWYAINVPIVRAVKYNGRHWIAILGLIDSFFLWYANQYFGLSIFVAYVAIGTFQLIRAPWNTSINWLILLAPISWVFLVVAPLAKLPVGLPLKVWGYTERAIGHQHNYIYFGLLGTLWLIVFNHLYFLPDLDPFLVAGLGVVWSMILGYAFLGSKAKRPNLSRKPPE